MHSLQTIQRINSIRVLSHCERRVVEEDQTGLALAEQLREVVSVQLTSQDVVLIDECSSEDEIQNFLLVCYTVVVDYFGNASASIDTNSILVLSVESRAC